VKEIDEEVVDKAFAAVMDKHKAVMPGLPFSFRESFKDEVKALGYTIKKKQPEPEPGQVWIGCDRVLNAPIYLTNNERSIENGFGYIRLDELVDGRTAMNIEYLLDNYTFGYHSLEDYYREKFKDDKNKHGINYTVDMELGNDCNTRD